MSLNSVSTQPLHITVDDPCIRRFSLIGRDRNFSYHLGKVFFTETQALKVETPELEFESKYSFQILKFVFVPWRGVLRFQTLSVLVKSCRGIHESKGPMMLSLYVLYAKTVIGKLGHWYRSVYMRNEIRRFNKQGSAVCRSLLLLSCSQNTVKSIIMMHTSTGLSALHVIILNSGERRIHVVRFTTPLLPGAAHGVWCTRTVAVCGLQVFGSGAAPIRWSATYRAGLKCLLIVLFRCPVTQPVAARMSPYTLRTKSVWPSHRLVARQCSSHSRHRASSSWRWQVIGERTWSAVTILSLSNISVHVRLLT